MNNSNGYSNGVDINSNTGKQFDNNVSYSSDDVVQDDSCNMDAYRSISNLNTAIENPQLNINSATKVNIKDNNRTVIDDVEFVNSSVSAVDDNYGMNTGSRFMNASYVADKSFAPEADVINPEFNSITAESSSQPSENNIGEGYSYKAVMVEDKNSSENVVSNLIHSKEFKIFILIIFILIVFLLLMPYIYDYIMDLTL